ncbi:MAG TPA: hypothetical protein VFV38_30535 [Ktedonobacteraceae bacterium]|nr:hypothetical protein [Ktedonobacteraceae bacterium]
MNEEIRVDFDALDQQAKLHQQFSLAFQDVITTFKIHHETILNFLPADHMEPYRQWWEDFSKYLQQHVELHNQLGTYLQKAKDAYITNEQNTKNSFTPS